EPRELMETRRIARREEAGIARLEAHLRLDGRGPLRPDVLRDRTGAARALLLAPEDVAEPRLAFLLCPGVHAVAERSGAAARRRDRPHADLRVLLDHAGEHLEARAAEVLGDILHLDGVAQVRLVGAVLLDGGVVRNALPALIDLHALGREFLKESGQQRL